MHKSTEKYNDICALKHNMLHYVMGETEKGFEDDPTKVHVLGEYIDMIKDLAEAEKECQEADYYESVVQAMEDADMGGYERMGYNPNRRSDGRYSDGRGSNRSRNMGRSGSDGSGSRSNMGGRSGYEPDFDYPYTRMMMPGDDRDAWGEDDDDMRYGRSFNKFRKAKRHYTKTHSEEDKQKMKDASNEHMMETMATLRELWDDADPELRKRMKSDMTNLMATMS